MNKSDEEFLQIMEWRKKKHLSVDRQERLSKIIEYQEKEPKNFHFFNYDPDLGPTDLSNVSLKQDDNHDTAVFSIPLSFTENSRTKLKSHNNPELGLDIQSILTPHNGKVYPLVK